MSGDIRTCIAILCCVLSVVNVSGLISDPQAIQDFLTKYNRQAGIVFHDYIEAAWTFQTNMTEYNQQLMLDVTSETNTFVQEISRNASQYNLSCMSQSDRRQFIVIMDIGTSAQTNATKAERLSILISDMMTIYSTPKTSTEPEVINRTAVSGEHDSRNLKDIYAEYVNLSNEAVRILGYPDTGAYWRSWYESPTFEDDVRELFVQLNPLYEQLHAYIRRKLIAVHGRDKFPSSGHIPNHFMGNLQSPRFYPFPGKATVDVSGEMIRQNYTVKRIFETADDFFKSLGMIAAPPEFWNKSMLEQPIDGRLVDCVALALDFRNARDYRIKQCTTVDADNLYTAHHEMGHIQYFMQYAHQPITFRQGANPAFHEAIGEVISLSVQTEEHLYKIGLLDSVHNDNESDINLLMSKALSMVFNLPYYYIIEQWRWKVFKGDTTPDKYNEEWLNLTCRYRGISKPVQESSDDFHLGSVYHIIANVPCIRYFVGDIIKYQIHKALCNVSGHHGPLHRCDIYNSTEAGQKLGDVLKLGSSKPWTAAMQLLTGQTEMDASPLLEYFEPLMEYLRRENQDDYGWDPVCATPKPKICKAGVTGCTCTKHSECEGGACCKKGNCTWD